MATNKQQVVLYDRVTFTHNFDRRSGVVVDTQNGWVAIVASDDGKTYIREEGDCGLMDPLPQDAIDWHCQQYSSDNYYIMP